MTHHDTIRLTGVRAQGFHGVFDHEKRAGQQFIVDLTVWCDAAKAAAHDDISTAVNYAELADIAHNHITGPALNLIETVAERIAADVLAVTGVADVEVTVHKPQAPIEHDFADVSVTVRRSTP